MELQSLKNRFGIIGNSPLLNHALDIAQHVAPTDLSVLITGESGVGKESFSQIIHQLSARKHNPFIAVNCGAIPEGTIDSELFGHEKGSFTGAADARKGYFETVNGGTIFLDEVGELPHGTQARLLRVLETKEFIRVGSSKVQKTDVRVIAATNVSLLEKISQGKFREDLYYRLNTVPIKVPALRERQEDIATLFRKFCLDFAERYKINPVQLDDDAKDILTTYPWHGNIRELKNSAEQISLLSKNKNVSAADLRKFLPEQTNQNGILLAPKNADGSVGHDFSEREILYKVLFDMKNDLNELKKIVFGMGSSSDIEQMRNSFASQNLSAGRHDNFNNSNQLNSAKPVLLEKDAAVEIPVEQTYSLAEMEKEAIAKCLLKHRNRRRNAARELGISERTLYRKIMEYGLPQK